MESRPNAARCRIWVGKTAGLKFCTVQNLGAGQDLNKTAGEGGSQK